MYSDLDDRHLATNHWSNQLKDSIQDLKIDEFKYTDFNITEELGRGAFGTVFRAVDRYKNVVALKSLKVDSEKVMKAFINEFRLHRDVHFHNNILKFHGFCKNDDDFFLVIEYANSGTLRKYLKVKWLDWSEKLKLAQQITSALMYLHDHEVIHRDLHSKNILVHQGKIKLADFGLSRRISELSNNNGLCGVLPYIDPHNWRNKNRPRTKESDIYSLGVLLWEISSGHPPFENEIGDIGFFFIRVAFGLRESKVKGTPDEYVKLYSKCWDGDPTKRPDIVQVFEALDNMDGSVITSNPGINAPNSIGNIWSVFGPNNNGRSTSAETSPRLSPKNSGVSRNSEADLIDRLKIISIGDDARSLPDNFLRPPSRNSVISNESDTINIIADDSAPLIKSRDVRNKETGRLYDRPQFEFNNESFCFADQRLEKSFTTDRKANTWLNLGASYCQDVSNLTKVHTDNKTLSFNMTHFVTCQRIEGEFMFPKQLTNIFNGMASLFREDEELDIKDVNIGAMKDIKLMVLNEENFKFEIPEGLAFRFKGFVENTIVLELFHNEASYKLLERIKKSVVSRTVTKIADVHPKDDTFLDTQFLTLANNIYNDSKKVVKDIVLDMLVKDHVEKLRGNTCDFLDEFFTEGIIYLKEKENNSTEVSAFDVISQYSAKDNENMIIKNVLNSKKDRVWVLDSVENYENKK